MCGQGSRLKPGRRKKAARKKLPRQEKTSGSPYAWRTSLTDDRRKTSPIDDVSHCLRGTLLKISFVQEKQPVIVSCQLVQQRERSRQLVHSEKAKMHKTREPAKLRRTRTRGFVLSSCTSRYLSRLSSSLGLTTEQAETHPGVQTQLSI